MWKEKIQLWISEWWWAHKPLWLWNYEYKQRKVRVFMDMIDWECEVGSASGGNTVWPSAKNLKEHNAHWKNCGIVEVEIRFIRIIEPQNLEYEEQSIQDPMDKFKDPEVPC